MTAIGCIANSHRALLWADSLYFVEGRPAGHRDKLAINASARLAGCGTGCGTGRSAICAAGREAVAAAADIHELVEVLPRALCRIARDVVTERSPDGSCFLIAGWSNRWRRVIAYRFDAPAFQGMAVNCCGLPDTDIGALDPELPDDVVGSVQIQIADLARWNNCTITGKVTAVVISRDGVASRCPLDLEDGWPPPSGSSGSAAWR